MTSTNTAAHTQPKTRIPTSSCTHCGAMPCASSATSTVLRTMFPVSTSAPTPVARLRKTPSRIRNQAAARQAVK
jgi:hypothetical protein